VGHFSLDVDPDQLDAAAGTLSELGNHLTTRATEVTGTPGNISDKDWSGAARQAISTEMTGLGNQMARFGPMFTAAADKLKAVAEKARTAKDTTIPNLNSRWDGAQTTYNNAVSKNKSAYEQSAADLDPGVTGTARTASLQGLADTQATANADAAEERKATEGKLTGEYNTLVEDLKREFTAASTVLTDSTLKPVSDDTVSKFVSGGGTGLNAGWKNPDGSSFPPELGIDMALAKDMPLTDDRHAVIDGERVAVYLDGWERRDEKPPPSIPPDLQKIMKERANDPMYGQAVANKLGPEGVMRIMAKAKYLQHSPGGEQKYKDAEDPYAEQQRLAGLQDMIATGLGTAIASGSRAPGGLKDPNFGKTLIERDSETAALLFKYADKAGAEFSGHFMHNAGTAIYKTEMNDPLFWKNKDGNAPLFYGTDPKDEDYDPGIWFLRAADNGAEGAQAIMGDKDLMKHFLVDQLDHHGRSDAAGNVLRVATIEHARDPVPEGTNPQDSTAWKAAQISSMALDITGSDKAPLNGVKDELAGIISTYMPDVDRAFRYPDPGDPGVFDHTKDGWPAGITGTDGWPQFGIKIDRGELQNVLGDIGGDENSRKLIGQSASFYNWVRMQGGAEGVDEWEAKGSKGESPFAVSGRASTQLQGFLVSTMADADIADAKSEEEKRTKVAEAFLFPVEFIAVDKLGPGAPIANLALDKVTEGVTKAYVGEGVKLATEGANNDWAITRDSTKLQALEAARMGGLLTPDEMDAWPKDAGGQPKQLGAMSEEDRAKVLRDMGKEGGYAAQVVGAVEGSYNDYTTPYK
jgi:hypothetical protein